MSKQKLHTDGRITKSPETPEAGDDSAEAAADDPKIEDQPLDMRPFSTGHQIENMVPHDDETTQRMVQEGVDEAQNDEMAVASKTSTKSEG